MRAKQGYIPLALLAALLLCLLMPSALRVLFAANHSLPRINRKSKTEKSNPCELEKTRANSHESVVPANVTIRDHLCAFVAPMPSRAKAMPACKARLKVHPAGPALPQLKAQRRTLRTASLDPTRAARTLPHFSLYRP